MKILYIDHTPMDHSFADKVVNDPAFLLATQFYSSLSLNGANIQQ